MLPDCIAMNTTPSVYCTRDFLTFPVRTYILSLQQISTNIINATTQSNDMYTVILSCCTQRVLCYIRVRNMYYQVLIVKYVVHRYTVLRT